MKNAFTLIELLVVMVVIALVMGMVVPMGSKMLSSFTNYTEDAKDYNAFKAKQFYSFIEANQTQATYLGKDYTISSKGVIREITSSDDDR